MGSALKTVILIFVGLAIIVLLTMHYLTKTRTKGLNDTEPFRPLIGKTVTTLRPVQVYRKKKIKNKDYPYDLYELGIGRRYPGSDGFERSYWTPFPKVLPFGGTRQRYDITAGEAAGPTAYWAHCTLRTRSIR